jgi:pentatricopeptide repeat domain-containing protein 1
MQGKGIEQDAYHFSSAISVCAKARQWKKALELLQEMDIQGIQPDVFCYNAAISACEKGGKWEKKWATGALHLMLSPSAQLSKHVLQHEVFRGSMCGTNGTGK